MKKRVMAILLGAMLAASTLLVGCGGNGGDDEARVTLIVMDRMDQHWVTLDGAAQAAAADEGVTFTNMSPETKDDALQIEQINNAIADRADVIIIASNGPETTVAALEEAKAEGIYIIYVDSPANTPAEARFLTNNHQAGATAGEELLAALTADGITSGDIGVVNVNPATQSTVDREAGFREAFAGTDFVILETEFTEGDIARSQQAAQNFIVDGVVAIFGTNEGGSTGVGNAIDASGGAVLGIGFDTSDALLGLVRDGALIAVMAQNPDVMGDLAVRAAAALMRGESLAETDVDTGVSVITAADL
jgi:ribose transport system substrate-binding protein